MDGPLIFAQNLNLGYDGSPVIKGVHLELMRGEFVAVLGPNAAGKSTLLRGLAGLLRPLEGVAYLNGKEVSRLTSKELARSVGVLLTERVKLGLLTVYDVVALGRYPYTGMMARLSKKDREVVFSVMEEVGIAELFNMVFDELSDGQKQKVMIARALAQEPSVLILDEPTTHLDPRNKIDVVMLLKRLARDRGLLVVASMHEVELALRVADRVIVVNEGEVEVYDQPEELVTDGGISRIFGLNGGVTFDPRTMSMEVPQRGYGKRKGFVIAGGGTGAIVYRIMARLGYDVSTGVLHENDLDYYVARALGLRIVSEKPFSPIGRPSFDRAADGVKESELVIYTNPPIGTINERNVDLLELAKSWGKWVIEIDGSRLCSERIQLKYLIAQLKSFRYGMMPPLNDHYSRIQDVGRVEKPLQ